MPIFCATSGNSLRLSTGKCLPPVASAISVSSPGPASSSAVRPRPAIGSKIPIANTWTSASRTSFLISLSVYRLLLSPPSDRMMIAFRGLRAFFIWFIAMYTPSRSAVRPFACVNVSRFWISSVFVVNPDYQLRPIVELDEKEFIFGVRSLEQLRRGLTRFGQFAAHAAARVKDKSNRQRRIFARELRDGLRNFIFGQREVLFLEARNETVHRIRDGHIDQNQNSLDPDARFFASSSRTSFEGRALGSIDTLGLSGM